MHVLIIGYGSMGRRHAANARALGHVVSVAEPDEAKRDLARADGLLVAERSEHGRIADLASYDAAVIATPAATHARIAASLVAEEWFEPLFVEKPLGVTVEECAVFAAFPVVQVGYNWRYHAGVQAFREQVERVGSPMWWHLICESEMASWPGSGYGDPLLEFSHEIDLVCWLRSPYPVRLLRATNCYTGDGVWLLFDTGDIVSLRWRGVQKPSRLMSARLRDEIASVPLDLGETVATTYLDELRVFLATASGAVAPVVEAWREGQAIVRICAEARARLNSTVVTC